MSKFVFYTDFHLANKRPVNRSDDFASAQIGKLREIYEIAKSNKVDFVLFGGDFFNTHRIYQFDLISAAIDIICGSGLITYAVQGQHDLIGHQRDTYKKSTLAFMERYSQGAFTTLWEPLKVGDFAIYPCHWFDDLETCLKTELEPGKNTILLAHKSITMKKHPFPTILTKDMKSNFQLILSGDIHSGHEIHTIDGTTFYNPGAITRLKINDKSRKPAIALIESGEKIKIKEIQLTVKQDVWNINPLEELEGVETTATGDKFFDEIAELEAESVDLMDLLQKFGIQKQIKPEILDYISSKMARV